MQADCVLPDAVKREGSRDAGNAMSYNLPHFTAAFDHLPHQASGWSTAPEVFQPAFHTASSRHSRLQLAASAYGQKPPIRHINKRAWNDSTTQNSTCKQSRVAQMKCTCPVRRCLAASHTSTKQRRPHILDTEALAEQVEVLSLLQVHLLLN